MGLEQKDIDDMRMARPVAVIDVWDLHDLLEKMEAIVNRLGDITRELHDQLHEERQKNWQLILEEMLKQMEQKGRQSFAHRTGGP